MARPDPKKFAKPRAYLHLESRLRATEIELQRARDAIRELENKLAEAEETVATRASSKVGDEMDFDERQALISRVKDAAQQWEAAFQEADERGIAVHVVITKSASGRYTFDPIFMVRVG